MVTSTSSRAAGKCEQPALQWATTTGTMLLLTHDQQPGMHMQLMM
jgi:hypothetical protein